MFSLLPLDLLFAGVLEIAQYEPFKEVRKDFGTEPEQQRLLLLFPDACWLFPVLEDSVPGDQVCSGF